jgi:hypothetical protein
MIAAIFILSFILSLIPNAFGSPMGYDYDRNNLIYAYRNAKNLYQRQLLDESFQPLFVKIQSALAAFVVEEFRRNPLELFNLVREEGSFQFVHFVIGVLNSAFILEINTLWIWEEHLRRVVCKGFFRRSKDLMNFVVRRKDWPENKEILAALLLIQRQYLYQLKPRERTLQKVRQWIEEYEIILRSFDPSNLDGFLRLFEKFQAIANNYERKVIFEFDLRDFPIFKSFKLFKLYCFHFYKYNWDKLDIFTLPPKFVCMISLGFSRRGAFDFLLNPNGGYLIDFQVFIREFKKIKKAFEAESQTRILITDITSQRFSEFYTFLCSCLDSNVNICNFKQKEFWFLEVILHVLPIFRNLKVIITK